MPFVNIRELARDTSRVVSEVASSGRPAIITRGGKPVATLLPIDAADLEDWVLANHPDFVRGYAEAERDLAEGRTISLDRYLEEQKKRETTRVRRRSGVTRTKRTKKGRR